jgi:subfamily B ATP-binding cassette protein MsbA
MKERAPSIFRWLVSRYATRQIGAIALVSTFALATNLLTVIQPMILAAVLSNLVGPSEGTVPADASWLDLNYLGARVTSWLSGGEAFDADSLLLLFGVLFLVQVASVAVTTYGAEYGAVWLRLRFTTLIQFDVMKHLLSQDISFFTKEKSGSLISRLTRDAGNAAEGLSRFISRMIHYTVQITVYSLYLISTSIWLTVGAVVLLLVQSGLTELLRRPTRRLVREETDSAAAYSTALHESFLGVRITKSFGVEAFEFSRLKAVLELFVRSILHRARFEKLELPARSILDALAVVGVFVIGISQMRSGELNLQGLLLFIYVGRLLVVPINGVATNLLLVEAMKAAFDRINDLLSVKPHVSDGAVKKTTFDHSIRFSDVSFSYDGHPALRAISIEIKKQEFVAVVGPSGAGKSTFVDLVLRLYDPSSGEIFVDGVDLKTLRFAEYRRLFGVVPQETLLFNDTIRQNIRYGRSYVSEEDIYSAARVANIHEFIMALPNRYDTVIGERGLRLSGGERQRVSIARALAHKPQVLILDEATSSLDSESERLVQQSINQVVATTTAIVIAHRLSTVLHADRIIVLANGEIESVGTNDSLLASSATYQTLHRLQFGESPRQNT